MSLSYHERSAIAQKTLLHPEIAASEKRNETNGTKIDDSAGEFLGSDDGSFDHRLEYSFDLLHLAWVGKVGGIIDRSFDS